MEEKTKQNRQAVSRQTARRTLGALAIAAFAGLGLAACVVEPAQPVETVVVRTPPPPPRVEVVPAERSGYAWAAGHWRWVHGAYEWEPGHWEVVRVGHHWVPGHWAQRGPGWVWVEGRWAR